MSRWVGFVVLSGCAVPAGFPPVPGSAASTATIAAAPTPKTWRPVTTAPFAAAAPLLLTDGTVMIQNQSASDWWQLTPNEMGDYAAGTWKQLASMPNGYAPLYTASAVLPDGRVIVQGGEYDGNGPGVWTTKGALYDPIANSWKNVPPPAGWQTIGDASGMVTADGRWMLTSCCDSTKAQAFLDLNTMVYTPTGMGKLDIHDEESWVQLYDDTILTVDCNNKNDLTAAESFDPKTGVWSPAGHTPVQLSDLDRDGNGSHEIGPNVLRHDGTVLALGATGHNATYDPATMTWTAAPDLPNIGGQLDLADGPAAIMPNGNVLVPASPGVFNAPTHYFEWDGMGWTPTADPPAASGQTTYQLNLMVLPSGEILMTDFSSDVEVYTPAPGHADNTVPVITQAPQLMASAREIATSDPNMPAMSVSDADGVTPVSNLFLGKTYKLSVLRMNGITQGAYYGDDEQSYTNYPIIRLTYQDSGHVLYLRSHDHSNRAIGPDKRGTTLFDVPATAERGLATLESVANGISSPPVLVNVK
ncbi:MAG: hypothetical protein JO257_35670 [Deltaproteobacteria bacterium]|nr:hypothetical protein [Deltaproteobacteria bacterium]